jgi:hypothetical protein
VFDFVINNQRILDSPGFSCIISQFDLEKGTPLENNPSEWGITELYTPPDHDLSLGYSYKIDTGMDSDEAEVLYRELQEKINEKVSTFPDNYSLSDGLLYLGHPQDELSFVFDAKMYKSFENLVEVGVDQEINL